MIGFAVGMLMEASFLSELCTTVVAGAAWPFIRPWGPGPFGDRD